MKIPLAMPSIGDREVEYVTRVLRSGRLSLGPALAEFEERFADCVGARYAIAVSSGTAALHLAVKALGIGSGDEVLTTSFSFAASANCLLYEGALPAFADIDAATLNISPAEIREILARDYEWDCAKRRAVNRCSGRALKAILPVHIFGVPCDMAAILEIAREFNLQVIEDACEALGARYAGRHVGTFGDAAAFAFYPNKQITTAEGGMLVTNDLQIASLCRCLRNQGRAEGTEWLVHARLGYNYRLSDLHAALGLAQLERVDELLAARERLAAAYSRLLAGIPEIALPCTPPEMKRSWFVYPIRVRDAMGDVLRNHLMSGLRERGIACQAYFSPIHRQPYFRAVALAPRRPLPRTEEASETCLALPFFPAMTDAQFTEVCAAIAEILVEARDDRTNVAEPASAAVQQRSHASTL